MKNGALVVAVFVLPSILAAFAVGWALSGMEVEGRQKAPQPVASTVPAGETVPQVLPEEDVPGRDLAGLPRYPGSTRVEYRHEKIENLTRTRAEYVTSADPDEIRTFYRDAFRSEGWVVADLNFSPETWYFFVVMDAREALVEIHALGEPVLVEIELTGPVRNIAGGTPAPSPARPAAGPPPPAAGDDGGDDTEEDDGYYEGGDD